MVESTRSDLGLYTLHVPRRFLLSHFRHCFYLVTYHHKILVKLLAPSTRTVPGPPCAVLTRSLLPLPYSPQTLTGGGMVISSLTEFAIWDFEAASGNPFSCRLNEHASVFVPHALLEIFTIKSWRRKRLISRRPSFRIPKTHSKDPHTTFDIYPRLSDSPLIPRIDVTAPSSLSINAPKSRSIATKTPPPDVCL